MIRLAVVGVGHLGRFHAQKVKAIAGAELAFIVEPNKEPREKAAQEFGVPAFASLDELKPGMADGIILAAPTVLHCELGKKILDMGYHLLVEKPIAHNSEAAKKLLAKAKEHKRILQVGMVERFNPAIESALAIADKPRYMVAERLGPFSARSIEIDVVRDLMIHDIDIMLCLHKAPIVNLQAVGVPIISNIIDMANVRIEFADGSVAQLTASRASLMRTRTIRLFTVSRYLSIDCEARTVKSVKRLPPDAGHKWPEIVPESIAVNSEQDPLQAEVSDFVRVISTSGKPRINGDDGVAALQVAEDILKVIKVPHHDEF